VKSRHICGKENGNTTHINLGTTPTFDALKGMLATLGGIRFNGQIPGHTDSGVAGPLDTEGQMSMTFTSEGICKRDNGSSANGSEGVERTAFGQMWVFGGGTGNAVRSNFSHSVTEQVSGNVSNGATTLTRSIISLNKPTQITVTISWTATTERLFVNGILEAEGTRTVGVNDFFALALGSSFTAANFFSAGETLFMKDLVISDKAVLLKTPIWSTFSINGDSFALQAQSDAGDRLDGTIRRELTKVFIDNGFEPPAFVSAATPGITGGTICDTGALDLSAEFTAWGAAAGELAIFLWSNNDSTVLDTADVTNATTGTKANGETMIGLLGASVRNIVMLNTGSLKQNVSLDTQTNRDRRDDIVNPILKDFESFDNRVITLDAATILGNNDTNVNYDGWWDELGNDGSGPTGRNRGGTAATITPQASRHLSGSAGAFVARAFFDALPFLTTGLTRPLTGSLTG